MPELPDVEVFKHYLDTTALHQRIARAAILHKKIVRKMSGKKLSRLLKDRTLEESHRHGKVLFVKLNTSHGWMWFHFGMTGYFTYGNSQDPDPEDHVRFMLEFAKGGILRFHCPRLFGQVGWVADLEEYLQRHKLGPDALAISQSDFIHRFQGTNSGLKAAFMNQAVVAGIGNVYADEIIFKTRLHPQQSLESLNEAALRKLYRDMRTVLNRAIEYEADPEQIPDSWLLRHRRAKSPCPRCEGTISRVAIQQRSTYFCDTC